MIGWRDHIGTYRRMIALIDSHGRRPPEGTVGHYGLARGNRSIAKITTKQLRLPVTAGHGTRDRAIQARGGVVGAQSRPGVTDGGYVGSAAAQTTGLTRLIIMQPSGRKHRRKPARGVMTSAGAKRRRRK